MTIDEASAIPSLDQVPLFRSRPTTAAHAASTAPAPDTESPEALLYGQTPVARPVTSAESEFWTEVNTLRLDASSRLTRALEVRLSLDKESREELGRTVIQQVVRDRNDARLTGGGVSPWTTEYQTRLVKAVFDALFRLGRLQPLVERNDVVDIEIYGYDRVLLIKANGEKEFTAPVADSDEDLVAFLAFLATRDPAMERSFTPASPSLEMTLPGRGRLAALAWDIPRPRVTIRLQHLQEVDLTMLRQTGEVDAIIQDFLAAAVRARKSIVVSGQGQGSGKTTLLRALAAALDPWESIATIETDYELYLHEEPDRHYRVLPLQTRTGSGELTAAGTKAGEINTGTLFYWSLRHSIDRIIVGEVRGPEVATMFEAMQGGNGSLSTVHANNAKDVIERLVGLAIKDSSLSETYAYRQIAQTIDLIVFISMKTLPSGKKHRFVSEIIEVTRGEQGNPVAVTHVFQPGPGGRAVPAVPPTFIDDLVAQGFDRNLFTYTGGLWEGSQP